MRNIQITSTLENILEINPIEEDTEILIHDIFTIKDDFKMVLSSNKDILVPYSITLKITNMETIPGGLFRAAPITKLIIGAGVKRIEKDAFADCKLLYEVDTTGAINLEYFSGLSNSNVENLEIPPSVLSIPYLCSHCTNLKKVTLNERLLEISEKSFSFCTALKAIEIKGPCEQVAKISNSAFEGCSNLQGFYYTGMNQNTKISDVFPNISSIGPFAFKYCKNLKLTIDATSISKIDCEAFAFCRQLFPEVNLTNTKLRLGAHVFENTSVTKIKLSETANYDNTSFTNMSLIDVTHKEIKTEANILAMLNNLGGL